MSACATGLFGIIRTLMSTSRVIVFVATLAATAGIVYFAIPSSPAPKQTDEVVLAREAPATQPGTLLELRVNDRDVPARVIVAPEQLTEAVRRPPAPTDDAAVLLALPMEFEFNVQGGGLESPVDVAFINASGEVVNTSPLAAGPLGEVRASDKAMFALLLPYKKADALGIRHGVTITLPDLKSAKVDLPSLPIVNMSLGGVDHTLEVADDMLETMVGLMYRDAMPAHRGMIFAFPHEQPLAFYMRNTRIPLDVIYVAEAGAVVSVVTLKPFDETSSPSAGPARYVIELNAGEAAKLGIKAGDKLTLPDLAQQSKADKN
jgi:uncharacterized membrane protein (UPF0127 family)